VKHEFGIDLKDTIENETYDTIILAVAHKEFLKLDISKLRNKNSLIYDIKGVLSKELIDTRL
jgi:UDP-N-acetyl-D-galactosamine dehydrogenase